MLLETELKGPNIRGQLGQILDSNTITALKTHAYLSGTVTLASGTATVTNPKIRTTSVPLATHQTHAGTIGTLRVVATDGQITITSSSATDTSVVNYLVIL